MRACSASGFSAHTGANVAIGHASGECGSLVLALAEGAMAYALLAPKFFVTRHPIWGSLFAIGSFINLASIVD